MNDRPKFGWFEEYACGCLSPIVARKRDLVGYFGKHGDERRGVFRVTPDGALQTKRVSP